MSSNANENSEIDNNNNNNETEQILKTSSSSVNIVSNQNVKQPQQQQQQIYKVPLTPSKSKTSQNQSQQQQPQQPQQQQPQQPQQQQQQQQQQQSTTPLLQSQSILQSIPQTITSTLQQQQQVKKEEQKQKLIQQTHINSLIQSGPPQLSPPALFGTIEPLLYRTNSLYPANFPFIKLLGLKTVVQLSPEVPIKAVSSFFQENNINLIHLGLKSWKVDISWKPLTDELIKECLEIVLNYDYYPLMITCTSGVHQTGVLVGCLRRLQNWNLTSILVEYKAFSGQSNTRYVNEQFIELFDVDLVTFPNKLPTWFIEQQKMLEEELEEFENSSFTNNNSNENSVSNSTDKLSISTELSNQNNENNNNNNNSNNNSNSNSVNSSSNSVLNNTTTTTTNTPNK
ncbi:hypothetical protein DDB_G0280073 [Dictyostelium discoideum AX4]|uniref:Protein-tyrosine-phosphatase n=1 Tax=Dictyostelium discoideum TaxID=44689 RepID=Q54VX9_DICDI|nr:hypothetical protein DDB_G0280073 [Dictyostelium discoideum AX4]EAL67263.1 hypothetical protein DDB_G0280073 [Dictyostelium discoideum AX4]|eukprot:XP_641226.1 hypothetical protein DDB_G0280073 [Dictyostelium discoideum AX4]